MKRIDRYLLVIVFGSLAIGCSLNEPPSNGRSTGESSRGKSQPTKTEKDAMEYTTAEVTFLKGDLAKLTKRIADQEEIRRLLSFFPGPGHGRKGPEPSAPWINAVLIQFTRADGTVLKVTSNFAFFNKGPYQKMYFWSEGQGDWMSYDTKGLQNYIRILFQVQGKSAKQGEK